MIVVTGKCTEEDGGEYWASVVTAKYLIAMMIDAVYDFDIWALSKDEKSLIKVGRHE